MKTQTYVQILKYIGLRGNVSIKNISDKFQISTQMAHRHVKKALNDNKLTKKGKPPKVYYSLNKKEKSIDAVDIDNTLIDEKFCFITATGQILEGKEGFLSWCNINNYDPIAYAYVFQSTYKKYFSLKDSSTGLIDLTNNHHCKINKNLSISHLYTNFVSEFEIFGKTKEFVELLNCIGKQDKKLMQNYFIEIKIKDIIKNLIKKHNINAVAYCPSLESKKHEIMHELRRHLKLSIPLISINRIQTNIFVDKIKSIKTDYIVDINKKYKNILLIDSYFLSGQKFISFSKLLSQAGIKNIIGLVFCGRYL